VWFGTWNEPTTVFSFMPFFIYINEFHMLEPQKIINDQMARQAAAAEKMEKFLLGKLKKIPLSSRSIHA
jgi:hypothetical protein